MTYGEFLEFVSSKCLHETIYTDSDGHPILVIRLLDAYGMVNKLQRPWVGLTYEQKLDLISDAKGMGGKIRGDAQLIALLDEHEAKLKGKNA